MIIIANVNRKDLEALLNYMYLGEVSVFRTELKSLVKAAEILKIKGLAEQTENSPVKEKRSSSWETDQPESKRTKSEDYFSVYIKQKESERSHVKDSNSKSKILDSNALNDQDRKDSEVTIDDSLDSVGEFVSAEVSESRRTESSSESNQDPPEVGAVLSVCDIGCMAVAAAKCWVRDWHFLKKKFGEKVKQNQDS